MCFFPNSRGYYMVRVSAERSLPAEEDGVTLG